MDNRVLVVVDRNKVMIEPTPENIMYLNFHTGYKYSYLKIDKRQTNITRRKCYTTETVEGYYYEYSKDGSYITLPYGLLRYLPEDTFNIVDESDNKISMPELSDSEITNCLDNYVLRADQTNFVRKCIENKRGIIQAATASGKSVMITAIVKLILNYNPYAKILLIEPYSNLINQMKSYFMEEGIPDERFTVSTALTNKMKDPNELEKYNVLIMDEVQHGSSNSWYNLAMNCINAEYIIGFSAKTISDSNKNKSSLDKLTYNDALIMGITGPIIGDKPPSEYINEGVLSTPVLMALDFTHENLDKVNSKGEFVPELDWQKCIKYGLMNDDRLSQLALSAVTLANHNRRVLILVLTKIQGYDIADWIVRLDPSLTVGICYGGNSGKYLNKDGWVDEYSSEVLREFKAKSFNILIGTSVMDEGADIPYLDAVVIAGGGRNARRLIQRVGRVLRLSKTGKYAYIIDCEDKGSQILNNQFRKRLTIYATDIGLSMDRIVRSVPISMLESKFKKFEGLT